MLGNEVQDVRRGKLRSTARLNNHLHCIIYQTRSTPSISVDTYCELHGPRVFMTAHDADVGACQASCSPPTVPRQVVS